MGASITLAGESLIAQKQGNGQILDVTQIIFGFIPGLDTTQPVDRTASFPAVDNVVYTMNITRKGYLSPNQVVYSALLGSEIGDFDFNWMGLSTAEGVLLIAAYVPTQQKRREIPPLQSGNNLTRNIVLEYDGAQGLTGITVPASTWQFDFSTEFAAIRQDIAALKVAVINAASAVSLDGPVLIYPNSANIYKITDYNRFSVFSATTSVGTVTISADTLTLNIPSGAATGVVSLEVIRDGVTASFKVALGASAIGTPNITSPANLAVGVALATTITTSAFVAYPASADIHYSTDWRIKNAAGGVVWQSLGNTANKISITVPANALQPGIQYFPEARHNGSTLGSSQYSPATKFTTSAVSITTPTILSPINGATGIEDAPTFQLSAFATVPAASDNHKSTSWRLRNALGDVVWSSMADTINLTKLDLPAGVLTEGKNHTIEFQYNGVTLPSTPWQSSGFVTVPSFEFGKYLLYTQNVAPFFGAYGQDVDTFTKLDNPSVLPAARAQDVAVSADGAYMAICHSDSPFISFYKRKGDEYTKLANPATLPSYEVLAAAFSPDGAYVALATGASPYIIVYKKQGEGYVKLPDPVSIPGGAGTAVAFSAGGTHLALSMTNSPYLVVYKRDEDTLVKLNSPASVPANSASDVVFSPDGNYLTVATKSSPFVYSYKRAADVFTLLSRPTALPPSTLISAAYSGDGVYLALTSINQPFLTLYKRSGDTLTKLAEPANLPFFSAKDVAFSADSLYMAVTTSYTPYIFMYKRNGDVFNKLADPAVLPSGACYGVAFTPSVPGR